jgi:predicted AAA+ superfamily ATPase
MRRIFTLMLARAITPYLLHLATQYPVVTVLGPRQSGKTTLCRQAFPHLPYVNLEAPDIRQFAIEDPRGFLRQHPDGALLAEVQRTPDLLSYIQVDVDAHNQTGRYLLTGSQQLHLHERISQSLAGRTALLKLLPFSLAELHPHGLANDLNALLFRGFYPRIYDAGLNPTQALGDYVETYIQRDLRAMVHVRDLAMFTRFLGLLAGRVGQLLNLSQLANDAGVTHTTVGHWLSLLETGFIAFKLRPYFANLNKRLTKTCKLYFYDVGLVSYLLGIRSPEQLIQHPLRGALVENLVVAEAIKAFYNQGLIPRLYFYRDSGGLEVDLLAETGAGLLAAEIKAGETVSSDYFKSLHKLKTLLADRLHRSWLLYGGESGQTRTDIEVVPVLQADRLFADWTAIL